MQQRQSAHDMAYDTRAFCAWFKGARPGDTCVYHAGNLAHDRTTDSDLADLADTVMLLNNLQAVKLRQFRQYLAIIDLWCYVAVKAAGGFAPRSIIDMRLTAQDYRALVAVRDRAADISVTRAIRDALSASMASPEDGSVAIFNRLKNRKLIEEAPGKGWQVSPAGVKAMT